MTYLMAGRAALQFLCLLLVHCSHMLPLAVGGLQLTAGVTFERCHFSK